MLLSASPEQVRLRPVSPSHSVAQAAQAIDLTELSDLRLLQHEYWSAFQRALNRCGGPLLGNKKLQPQHYMNFPIGKSMVQLNVAMIRSKSHIRVALNLCGVNAKLYFRQLRKHRQQIKKDFDHPLQWHEMVDSQENRIAYYLNNVEAEDRADWPRQHQWLADYGNALYRAFAPRVSRLDPDADEIEAEVA